MAGETIEDDITLLIGDVRDQVVLGTWLSWKLNFFVNQHMQQETDLGFLKFLFPYKVICYQLKSTSDVRNKQCCSPILVLF